MQFITFITYCPNLNKDSELNFVNQTHSLTTFVRPHYRKVIIDYVVLRKKFKVRILIFTIKPATPLHLVRTEEAT